MLNIKLNVYSTTLLLFGAYFLINRAPLTDDTILSVVILSLAYIFSAFSLCEGISQHISNFSYKNLIFLALVISLLVYCLVKNLFVIYANQSVQDVCRVSCPITFSSDDALVVDKEHLARFSYNKYGIKVMLPSNDNMCAIYQPNATDIEERNRKQAQKQWCNDFSSSKARGQKKKGIF